MNRNTLMEIEWECTRLSNAFAHLMDHKEYEKLANLFTEDGVFVRDGKRLVGRGQIIETLSARPSIAITRHVTTGIYFTHVDESSAQAISVNRSYFAMNDGGALPASYKADQVIFLDFEDTFVKTAEGWRIAARHTTQVLLPDSLRPMFGLAPR